MSFDQCWMVKSIAFDKEKAFLEELPRLPAGHSSERESVSVREHR